MSERKLSDEARALVLSEVALLREATFTTADGGCRPHDASLATWAAIVGGLCRAYDVYVSALAAELAGESHE